ncbi:MAG: alkaline phosphatase family protein [Acidobacteriota bacterium]|nr:alkaline phosphatase family protein [Blastocatellia bacterium]MDW8239709.1 alkaline phosphatase family protein [Acidobacteriota bacterium]
MARQKVHIIGIDGATFRLIDPLIVQGKLPTFKYIIENGVRGVLRSTLPPNSAVAWSSFMTGLNPGKHGVFGFLALAPERDRVVLTNGAHVKAKTLWELASAAQRRVAVLNVPMTYPPRPVNGILVSGMDASFLKNFTYPAEFGDELLERFPNYQIDFPFVQHKTFQAKLRQQLSELIDARKDAMLYLLEKTDPQLFVGVFTCTDRIQHHFWHCMDATHPKHHPAEEETIMADMYEQIDRALALILERMDEETTLLVLSDHGFCGSVERFLVNQWLWQKGWLRPVQRPRMSSWSRVLRAVKRSPRLYELARKVKSAWPGLKHLAVRERVISRSLSDKIDWSATKAYYFPPGIRINLKGREPFGVVEPAQFESLREALIEQLKAVRNERSAPVFDTIWRKEEVYAGPHSDLAPDIILVPSLSHLDARRNFSLGRRMRVQERGQLFVSDGPSGEHAPDGILLGIGRHLKRGFVLDGAQIVDIAPTVLYGLGLPIPTEMDGKPLTDIFTADFLSRTPPTFSSGKTESSVPEWQYDETEEEALRERLRDLGYLS